MFLTQLLYPPRRKPSKTNYESFNKNSPQNGYSSSQFCLRRSRISKRRDAFFLFPKKQTNLNRMKPIQTNTASASIKRALLLYLPSSHISRLAKLLLGIITASAMLYCGKSFAIGAGDADTAIHSYNAAFLITNGSSLFYKKALNNSANDGTWTEDLDIQGQEDAYERTGNSSDQSLVNGLLTTWLVNTPPPWSWDGWNDDIGWFSLALVRGYQMTGTSNFLAQAEYGFNYAFGRGWDTTFNGGGIWEQQPANMPPGQAPNKNPLSNDSLGQTACLLYESTGDTTYLNEAEQIYSWVRSHLFNTTTGQIYSDIETNGTIDTGSAAYNQGTFIDYADQLHKITGNVSYLNDAILAANYTTNHLTTGGIINNTAGYIDTWGAEFARGLGHLCKDNPQLWATYYQFLLANANAAWSHRRTDYNITWNGWAQPTPVTNNQETVQCVSAVALMQFTPATQPASVAEGTYKIINLNSGLAVDVKGLNTTNGSPVQQYGYNGGANQQWTLTSLGNGYYKIIGVQSGLALDVIGGGTANGTLIDIWGYNGGNNQQWSFTSTSGGYYRLTPANATGTGLDVQHSATTNSALLEIWGYSGGNSQQWSFQAP
jgi:predicted alpha-1,6-mannanase (GH76 family)